MPKTPANPPVAPVDPALERSAAPKAQVDANIPGAEVGPALSGRAVGIGAAVGIGSAAIVAALLFTKPWKR